MRVKYVESKQLSEPLKINTNVIKLSLVNLIIHRMKNNKFSCTNHTNWNYILGKRLIAVPYFIFDPLAINELRNHIIHFINKSVINRS